MLPPRKGEQDFWGYSRPAIIWVGFAGQYGRAGGGGQYIGVVVIYKSSLFEKIVTISRSDFKPIYTDWKRLEAETGMKYTKKKTVKRRD